MTQNSEPNLRIPGPVPLPEEALQAAARQMINHRGPEYADMLERMSANLRTVLMTKNDVYFITSSGTGAMETAVFNTVSPGDKVLAIIIGFFGIRFAEIAEAVGADVTKLEFPLGQAADIDVLRDALRAEPDYKAVILTHNESSSAVSNPLEEICKTVHDESDALILVDAVSFSRRYANSSRRVGHRCIGHRVAEILGRTSRHSNDRLQPKGMASLRNLHDSPLLLRHSAIRGLPADRPTAIHTVRIRHVRTRSRTAIHGR